MENKLTNAEKAEQRKIIYNDIIAKLAELDYDIDFAEIDSEGKTELLNVPFVINEKEGWAEIKVIIKGENYDGYVQRDSAIITRKDRAEKAEAKAKAKAKKKAEDEKRRAEKAAKKAEIEKRKEGAQ